LAPRAELPDLSAFERSNAAKNSSSAGTTNVPVLTTVLAVSTEMCIHGLYVELFPNCASVALNPLGDVSILGGLVFKRSSGRVGKGLED